jgi:hypothetical protein
MIVAQSSKGHLDFVLLFDTKVRTTAKNNIMFIPRTQRPVISSKGNKEWNFGYTIEQHLELGYGYGQ